MKERREKDCKDKPKRQKPEKMFDKAEVN